MSTREQFGKYLLLKKLSEDALGETFRAGMLGGKGMERVVLLRIFNGQGIDGQRLWRAAQEREGIHQVLRSPNIGEGVEMGEVQGIPFVAYDYVSGKHLFSLMQQAAKQRSFIPTDHALLITERIALALALASESRHQGERIVHGFVIPHLVMISNEGETRMLGFEAAPGMRTFHANPVIRQHFGRYLAPEALRGASLDRSDDIYSLGVILFELLTAQSLPAPGQDGYLSIIDQARLANEETPLPGELGTLLKQSLAPRENRIADIVAWHKTLNKWMFEGQYNPTTFNLAFYMHNLFRQEIERESQEIEVEKTLPLPVTQPQATAQPAPTGLETQELPIAEAVAESAAAAPVVASAPPPPPEPVSANEPEQEKKDDDKASKVGLWAALATILTLALGGAYYFWQGGQDGASVSEPVAAAQPAPAAPSTLLPAEGEDPLALGVEEEPPPAGPTPEEVQAQIDTLIEQKASAMEAELRKNFDSRLKGLQKELDDARQATEQREAELQQQADEARKLKEQEEAARLAEEEKKKAAAEEAKLAAEKPPVAEEPGTPSPAAGGATQVTKTSPPASPPPPIEPAKPQVRRGDLVKMGPGVVRPKVQRSASPRFPEMARRVGKAGGTIKVRVLIDENGRVKKAELANKLGFGFDAEALQAAKKTIYEPATKHGVPVKMWSEISVVFKQ